MNLCSLDYHGLNIFLQGELQLGRVLLLGEIRYLKFHKAFFYFRVVKTQNFVAKG